MEKVWWLSVATRFKIRLQKLAQYFLYPMHINLQFGSHCGDGWSSARLWHCGQIHNKAECYVFQIFLEAG